MTQEALVWTARIAAAARAAESVRPNALIVDAWAKDFAGAHASVDLAKLGGEVTTALVALRARWLDDALVNAVHQGLAGVVVVGAGFDVRPLRVPELQGLRWVEVDFDQLFIEKVRVLARAGGEYAVTRVAGNCLEESTMRRVGSLLAGTLERSWAWVFEGLLGYLEPAEVATLFTAVRRLTPNASALFDLPVQPVRADGVLPSFKTTSADIHGLLPEWSIEADAFQERRALASEHRLDVSTPGAAFYCAQAPAPEGDQR